MAEKDNVRPRWRGRYWLVSVVLAATAIVATAVILLVANKPWLPEITNLKTVSDGEDGAIVAWERDGRVEFSRVGAAGEVVWTRHLVGNLSSAENISIRILDFVADGQGGVFVTWYDFSVLLTSDAKAAIPVYAQRINTEGNQLWGNGILMGFADRLSLGNPEIRRSPQITSDGMGGAYIAHSDDQGLHLQKFEPDARLVWEETISPVSLPADRGFRMTDDDRGGLIVLAKETSGNDLFDVYAQRFDPDGLPLWPPGGVLVYSDWPRIPLFESDGAGGIVLVDAAMQQVFSGLPSDPHFVSAQWLHADGRLQWASPGITLRETRSMLAGLSSPAVHDSGAATLFWVEDLHGGPLAQQSLFAARIDNHGILTLQNESVFVGMRNEHIWQVGACNGIDGTFVAWRDGKWMSWEQGRPIYAQIINDQGTAAMANPISVFGRCLGYPGSPQIIEDGSGGAIVASIVGSSSRKGAMVYVQRLDPQGNRLWGEHGLRLDR